MPIASIQRGATERFPSLGILRKGAPKTEANWFSNPSRPEHDEDENEEVKA